VAVFTLLLSYRTCIKWLIICGILTVLRVGWSVYCVVCGLIALVGSSPWITESWCLDAGAGGFLWLGSCTILFDDVAYPLCTCVVCVCRRIQSRYVKVGDSELVVSVLKLRVRCGMPVATRVEVSLLYVWCK